MKNNLLLLLCLGLTLVSCTKKDKLHEQLMPSLLDFFEVQLGEDFDRENNIITITKVDTLTEKGRLVFKASELQRRWEVEELPKYERLKDDLAFFTAAYAADPTPTNQNQVALVKEACADLESDLQKLKQVIEETNQQRLTADSIQFRAYRVQGFFSYNSKKEGSQNVNLEVFMNYRFEVIPPEDILSY